MDLWIICLTLIFGALCIYLLSTWDYNFFEKHGVPFVRPTPIFGNMTEVLLKKKALPDVVHEIYNLNPEAKYVGFFDFGSPVVLLKDPELIKSVTIKNFDSFPDHLFFVDSTNDQLFSKNLIGLKGDVWREMRAILSPAFTSSKMKLMFTIMSQCAVDFADHLVTQSDVLDMKDTFGRYTLDVIASSAFGLSVNSMKDRVNTFYLLGKSISDMSGIKVFKFFLIRSCPWLAKLFNIHFLEDETAAYFTNVIQSTIAQRDAEGIVRPDMINLMMQARDKKETLSSEDIAAQAFIFLLGGFDSPATTMSYAAHALALNTEIQKKLQEEIDQVLERNAGKVAYDDLNGMKYLDAVVSETLRIFPPAAFVDRVCPNGFTLPPALPGLKPLKIKPGRGVWIPTYSFHHDPKYFPNPEKFDPERFNDENRSKISPFTYFPFGLGPRICIANRFAMIEVKLALFHVLAKCNLLTSDKTKSPVKLCTKSLLMKPQDGFWVKVEPRK